MEGLMSTFATPRSLSTLEALCVLIHFVLCILASWIPSSQLSSLRIELACCTHLEWLSDPWRIGNESLASEVDIVVA